MPGHHASDPVGKIKRHAEGGKKNQTQKQRKRSRILSPVKDGSVRLIHQLDAEKETLQQIRMDEQIAEDDDGVHDQKEGHKIPPQDIVQGTCNPKSRFRKKDAHAGIYQDGMYRPSHAGNDDHAGHRVPSPLRSLIQEPHQEAEQRSRPHAEDHAFHRSSAHDRRKNRVSRSHIEGGRLPHGRKPEYRAHGRSLLRAEDAAGGQHRNINEGKGDRFDMDIAQKGKGHEKLDGDQTPEQIFVFHTAFFFFHSPPPFSLLLTYLFSSSCR